MAKRQNYKRPHFYSIGSMLTDEEVHQVWEIVGNALDRNGLQMQMENYQSESMMRLSRKT